MTASAGKNQRGFSLLELLVAFSIMAMSLGLIYKAMGAGVRNVGDLTLHQQASMLAESLLNSRDSVTDQGWNEGGEYAPFTWRINSQPFASVTNAPEAPPLHQIQIVISWPDGVRPKQLEIQTLLPQRKPLPGDVIK